MSSHLQQNNKNEGRQEAESFAPSWLVNSLDLLETNQYLQDASELQSQENFPRRLKVEVRHQETGKVLGALPGPLAKHLERELPGTIPGGSRTYFSNFLGQVRERLSFGDTPKKPSPQLASSLDKLGRKLQNSLPENYFEHLNGQIHGRIDDLEEAPAWLDSVISSTDVFDTPSTSFFEQQRESIYQRLTSDEFAGRMTLIRSNRFRISAVAATAACIAIVFNFAFFQTTPVENTSLRSLHASPGLESIDKMVDIQEDIVGPAATVQLIRDEMDRYADPIIDLELVEPPAILNSNEESTEIIQ